MKKNMWVKTTHLRNDSVKFKFDRHDKFKFVVMSARNVTDEHYLIMEHNMHVNVRKCARHSNSEALCHTFDKTFACTEMDLMMTSTWFEMCLIEMKAKNLCKCLTFAFNITESHRKFPMV